MKRHYRLVAAIGVALLVGAAVASQSRWDWRETVWFDRVMNSIDVLRASLPPGWLEKWSEKE